MPGMSARTDHCQMRSLLPALAAALLLSDCSPPQSRIGTAPAPTRPSPAPAASSSPAREPAPPKVELPKPLPYPTLRPTRAFRHIALPKGVAFTDMAGAGNVVYLLAGKTVYVHDGKRVVHQAELCPGAKPDGYWLRSTHHGVVALGFGRDESYIVARLEANGAVRCATYSRTPDTSLLLGLTLLASRSGFTLPADTRPLFGIPLPPTDNPRGGMLFAPRRDSMWIMVFPPYGDGVDERAYHYFHFDGMRWGPTTLPSSIQSLSPFWDMWADPEGTVWTVINPYMFGVIGGPRQETHRSLAKLSGSKWTLIAVPEYFQPDRLTGTAADDVWFISSSDVFQWDGARWRVESFVPRKPTDPYANFHGTPFMDSTGSLWLLADTEKGWQLFRTASKDPAKRGPPAAPPEHTR